VAERELLNKIQIAFSRVGARLFRNNTGMGWAGKIVRPHKKMLVEISPSDVLIRQARPLNAGLCEGSSDLIGWTPVTITQSDVGKRVAIFTAVEVKYGSTRTTVAQAAWHDAIIRAGGLSKIARSVDDALDLLTWGKHE
jgi:VRR-NUC domain